MGLRSEPMLRIVSFALLFLVVFLATTWGVQGRALAESDEPVASKGEETTGRLRFVTGNDYPPFTGQDLPGGGMFTELVRAIYSDLGHRTEFAFRPWRRGYIKARQGDFLGTFPYIHTATRARDFHYSQPVWHAKQRLMVLPESDLKARTVEDLAGLSYCNPLGYTTRSGLEALHEAGRIRRQTPSRMTDCLRMLARGRVDFVPIGIMQGRAMARDVLGSVDRVRFVDVGLPDDRLHVLFSRKLADGAARRDRFDAALARFQESGRADAMVRDYLAGENLVPTN